MNLTKANIRDLKKVTVKIECSNGSEGSGTIVAVGSAIYILTAAHVIEKDTKDGHLNKDQIAVSLMRNSQKIVFKVGDVVYYNREDDASVILVLYAGDMLLSGIDKVRLLTTSVSGPAELCGYQTASCAAGLRAAVLSGVQQQYDPRKGEFRREDLRVREFRAKQPGAQNEDRVLYAGHFRPELRRYGSPVRYGCVFREHAGVGQDVQH